MKEIEQKNINNSKSLTDKGVTGTVGAVMLMGMTLAAAGTFYTIQDAPIEDSQDQNLGVLSAPIYIESCRANKTGTHFSVRNSHEQATLNTESTRVIIDGRIYQPATNKELVAPQQTYTVTIDEVPEDGVITEISNDDYSAEIFCTQLIPSPNADYSYTPEPVKKGETVIFEDISNGYIDRYEWYKDGAQFGTGETAQETFNNPGTYEIMLNVTDIRNDTDQHLDTS